MGRGIFTGVLFSLFFFQSVAAQTLLTNEGILASFAKTVRDGHYVCNHCERVVAFGKDGDGLLYRVECRSGLEYRVVVTARKALIVEPLQGIGKAEEL